MSKSKIDMASNSDAPEAKKPCKGILKTSSSFDRPGYLNNRKSAKFDEINVLQTFHPADKDYGHMKIDEPKTPYRVASGEEDSIDQLDAEMLAEKLRNVTSRSSFSDFDESPDEETEEERQKRKEFQRRRKAHYNEFEAVRRARQLMEEEEDEDDEDENETGVEEISASDNYRIDNNPMDVDSDTKPLPSTASSPDELPAHTETAVAAAGAADI